MESKSAHSKSWKSWGVWLLAGLLTTDSPGLFRTAQAAPEREELAVSGLVPSPIFGALDIQYIPSRYPEFPVDAASTQVGMTFRLGFEWLPLTGRFGKAGFGIGIGFGKTSNAVLQDGTAISFITMPLDANFTYRLDYVEDQILVPYGRIGSELHFARTSLSPAMPRYVGLNLVGGLAFLLDRIDPNSARSLDLDTGINNTYLIVEYLNSRPLSDQNQINLARDEIRLGLRFEM